jgi:hypothetical protein
LSLIRGARIGCFSRSIRLADRIISGLVTAGIVYDAGDPDQEFLFSE